MSLLYLILQSLQLDLFKGVPSTTFQPSESFVSNSNERTQVPDVTSNNNPRSRRHLKEDDYIWDEPSIARVTEEAPKPITPPPPLKRKSYTGRLKNVRIVDSDSSDDDVDNATSLGVSRDKESDSAIDNDVDNATSLGVSRDKTDRESVNEVSNVKRCDVRINKKEKNICKRFLEPYVPDNVSTPSPSEPENGSAPCAMSPPTSTSSSETSDSKTIKEPADSNLANDKGTSPEHPSDPAELDDVPPVICLDDHEVSSSESPRKRKWTINQYETLLSKRKRGKSKDEENSKDVHSKSEPESNSSEAPEKDTAEKNTISLENEENVWYNGNTYSCLPCSFETQKRSVLEKHLETEHKTSMSRWQKNIRRSDNKYTCKVCSHVTRHDQEDITRHVETQHMLDLGMYGRLYETKIKLLREKRKLDDASSKSPGRNIKGDEEKKLVNQIVTSPKSKINTKDKEEAVESIEKEIGNQNSKPSCNIAALEPKPVESSKSFKIPKIIKTVESSNKSEDRSFENAKDKDYPTTSEDTSAFVNSVQSNSIDSPFPSTEPDTSTDESGKDSCKSVYNSLIPQERTFSKGMYSVLRDHRKLLTKPDQIDSPAETLKPRSFKFKELRVLLKRVNVLSYENAENADKPETDVLSVEESDLVTEAKSKEQEELVCLLKSNDAIRTETSKGMYRAENAENADKPEKDVLFDGESIIVTEEAKPKEPEEPVCLIKSNDDVRPEISKGMYNALLEKRQTSSENQAPADKTEVSDVSACSIEETFRIKEAVQVVLKKDPDEIEFSSRLGTDATVTEAKLIPEPDPPLNSTLNEELVEDSQISQVQVVLKKDPDEVELSSRLGTDAAVTEAKCIPEPDPPLNSTLNEELEEDSQISRVIDDVLHDLDDPESSLTKIMDNFETEDLDALAEIEEGTFDSIPATSTAVTVVERPRGPEFEYLGSVDQEAEEIMQNGSSTVPAQSNGGEKEVQSSESQEVYIYCCPFDKCSFTTDFQVGDSDSIHSFNFYDRQDNLGIIISSYRLTYIYLQGIRSGAGAMHVINVHKMEPFLFKIKGLRWKKVSIEEQMENMFANA